MTTTSSPPTPPTIHKGEVWLVDFDPTRGAEIQKTRPAVVVNEDDIGRLPLRIVVPITDWKPFYINARWFTQLIPSNSNGLLKESGADAFQVESVSTDRFVQKVGTLSAAEMQQVIAAIATAIGYKP